MPTMTPWWRGRPTMDGKTARGASSPAKPACEPAHTMRQAIIGAFENVSRLSFCPGSSRERGATHLDHPRAVVAHERRNLTLVSHF